MSDRDEDASSATGALDSARLPAVDLGSVNDPEATQRFAAVGSDSLTGRHQPGSGRSRTHRPSDPLPEVQRDTLVADRYRLEEELTRRNQTLTWRAFDTKLSRPVLVHVLSNDDPRRDAVLEAARKAAIATDSRFLRVLDAVSSDHEGGTFIVCEFVPGHQLERVLQQGPLSVLEAAWVARELADALTPMHAAGLFHRQLNPDTVVITSTGSVKIVGFLIDSALAADPNSGSWAEREEDDVRALGQLLYACLVTRWPTLETEDRLHWGLKPAPHDQQGWLTPRQVRGGVSPALDQVCDQVLHARPRLGGTPMRSAHQIDQALSRVLGTADATADLEHRVRNPQLVSPESTGQFESLDQFTAVSDPDTDDTQVVGWLDSTRADHTTGDHPRDRDLDDAGSITATQAALSGSGPDPEHNLHTEHHHDPRNIPDPEDDHDPEQDPDHVHGPDHPRRRPPQQRRWLRVLLALITLSMVVGLVFGALRQAGNKGADDPAASPSSAGPVVLPISKVDDFDPEADGGNGEENPNQVAFAWDKKPTTAWQTLTYRGNPKMGGLKPGVGLVIDLGQPVKVSAVKLSLQGSPTAIAAYVPAGDSAAATSAPMTSIKQWRSVAANAAAGPAVELKPSGELTTRFVLIYVSSLPKVNNAYRAGISEVEVVQ